MYAYAIMFVCLFVCCLYVVLFVCALKADMRVVYIHFNRCYERNHSNFFCRLEMHRYFLSKLKPEEKSYSVAFQANLIPHLYTYFIVFIMYNYV